jgi:hypothetical protein
MQRKSRKIDAPDFLVLMCIESQKGTPSYNDLVSRFDSVFNLSASKQAISKKLNEACVLFFQSVLSMVINSKIYDRNNERFRSENVYKRVLIQDSTIIRLPLRLFNIFSGVSNFHSSVCNARIQGVYDIVSGRFLKFSIDPYSKNDITAATELEIRQNDLVIRDRGYLSNEEVERHKQSNANCIYRYKTKTTLLDPESNKTIDLINLLKINKTIDIEVRLNNKSKTRVRLIATPVSQEIAENRRRKAKKEDRGHNPSKEALELMGWTIYITTIPKEEADINKIMLLYSLRWRIEIIFKTWKSNMFFDKIHNVSYCQLIVLLTAKLIMIVILSQFLYVPCCSYIRLNYNREISMYKFVRYLIINPESIIKVINFVVNNYKNADNINEKLIKYCAYDKRKRQTLRQLENDMVLS